MSRPSLLLLMAAASAIAAVANAASIATGDQDGTNKTRLGNSIERDLSARDQDAAKRQRALDLREQAAKAAEQRLAASVEAQQKDAAGAPGAPGAPSPAEAQFDELARIYQAMKPAKAAAVFEQLDMEVQMKVAQRMRPASTAAILAAMTPKGAASLSMALARKSAAKPIEASAAAQASPAVAGPTGPARKRG
jgi:flagellar motility protein MotE (MotC chaperone)